MRFEFCNPTKIVFGRGVLDRLGKETAPIGRRALVVIGRGSVRRHGTLDRALRSLRETSVETHVFEGIEPNPRLPTVVRGGQAAREFGADVVVAVGGGSVMDAAKVIAALPFYEGDPWDMIRHGQERPRLPARALPVVTVPTLAATGSEMNDGAVITNPDTTEKSYVIAPCLYPRVAMVDPELTLTVPQDQTAYGIADLVTHVTESYFNGADGTPLQDRMAEGVVHVALEYGPRAVRDGTDIEAREQVQWASVVALNGWVQAGTAAPFPVHQIEHVISAHTDLAHGAGLAILSPAWMRVAARRDPGRYARFATRVFGVPARGPDDLEAALAGTDRLEAFFRSIGCPTRLSDAGIGAGDLERYARDTLRVGGDGRTLAGRPPMSLDDVMDVLRLAT